MTADDGTAAVHVVLSCAVQPDAAGGVGDPLARGLYQRQGGPVTTLEEKLAGIDPARLNAAAEAILHESTRYLPPTVRYGLAAAVITALDALEAKEEGR